MRASLPLLLATVLAAAPIAAQESGTYLGPNVGIDARASSSGGPNLDDLVAGLRFWAAADIWMLGDLRSAIKEVNAARNHVRVYTLEVPAAALAGPSELAQALRLSRNNRAAVHDTIAGNGTLVSKLTDAGFVPDDVELLNFYAGGLVWLYVVRTID